MIKSFLIGGCLALAFAPLSSAMAADITFTVTNEQTSGDTYTADMLVQHASGITELVPFMVTATGQYNMTIATPGSFYTPPGQASFRYWGPGAGSGNIYQPPGGGGGLPPPGQIVHGLGDSFWMEGGGEQVQAFPAIPAGKWLIGLASTCYASRLASVTLAQTQCLNNGGIRRASYGWCGGTMDFDCNVSPPPPQPVQPNPPGNGGGGGGGCAGCLPPRLIFVGFDSQVPQGTVTVGDIVNEGQ